MKRTPNGQCSVNVRSRILENPTLSDPRRVAGSTNGSAKNLLATDSACVAIPRGTMPLSIRGYSSSGSVAMVWSASRRPSALTEIEKPNPAATMIE